jgi:hypothetical protein
MTEILNMIKSKYAKFIKRRGGILNSSSSVKNTSTNKLFKRKTETDLLNAAWDPKI